MYSVMQTLTCVQSLETGNDLSLTTPFDVVTWNQFNMSMMLI